MRDCPTFKKKETDTSDCSLSCCLKGWRVENEVPPSCPFEAIQGLRGPLLDGTYVRPGNGVTSMFYKWDEAEGGWFWTPDQDKAFWMPASTTVVSQGKWEGKSPAFFNVEIINWLAANPMAPPDGVEAKSLDIISVRLVEFV